jgi:hypothetical protein
VIGRARESGHSLRGRWHHAVTGESRA